MCVPCETIKPGRKNANGPGPLRENRVPATSSPSARRRNLIKRLLAARRGLSTFRHLADTGRHSLTSLHAYTVAPRVRETRVLPFTVTRKRGARTKWDGYTTVSRDFLVLVHSFEISRENFWLARRYSRCEAEVTCISDRARVDSSCISFSDLTFSDVFSPAAERASLFLSLSLSAWFNGSTILQRAVIPGAPRARHRAAMMGIPDRVGGCNNSTELCASPEWKFWSALS